MGLICSKTVKPKSNRKFIDLGKYDFLVVGKNSRVSSGQTSHGKKRLIVLTLNLEASSLRQRRLKLSDNI